MGLMSWDDFPMRWDEDGRVVTCRTVRAKKNRVIDGVEARLEAAIRDVCILCKLGDPLVDYHHTAPSGAKVACDARPCHMALRALRQARWEGGP